MKMFVWDEIDGVSDRFHDGGGILVIAENLERARELLKGNVKTSTEGSPDCEAFSKDPNFQCDVITEEEKVFIFPNAGCC